MGGKSLDMQIYSFFQALSLVMAIVALLAVLRGGGTLSSMSGALFNFVAATTRKVVSRIPGYLLSLI